MFAVGERIYGSARPRSPTRRKLDLDSLLEVTEVPGIAIAGVLRGRPFQHFVGVRASSGHDPITDEGRYVMIWKRQRDGSWKLSMDMGVPQD